VRYCLYTDWHRNRLSFDYNIQVCTSVTLCSNLLIAHPLSSMKLTFLGLGFTLALLTGSAAACGSRRLGSAVNLTGTDEDLEARTLETVEHASHEAVDHVGHGCGTPSPTLEHRIAAAKVMQSYQKSGGRKLSSAVNYTIPVYFWAFHTPGIAPQKILTNQSIYNQHFVALQRGFKNTPFQFELKNIWILSNRNFGVCNMKGNEVEMKRRFRAPGKAVLNVYICDTTLSPMAAFWSSVPVDSDLRPQYDGIVLLNPRLAPTPAQSITAIENIVHETGHFLGKSTAQRSLFVLFWLFSSVSVLAGVLARSLLSAIVRFQDSITPLKEDAMVTSLTLITLLWKVTAWTTRLRNRLLLRD
jgi:hypothetical protein